MRARSFLFVPGDRPERFDKAVASGADVVVLDLEDAVLPNDKPAAREAVAGWLAQGNQAVLRINGSSSSEYEADLALLRDHKPSAIMLPKAETAEQIQDLHSQCGAQIPIIALVETAAGVWNALDVAQAAGTTRLAFGSIDFEAETGIANETEAVLYARSRLVLASAVAGKPAPIDGVTIQLNNGDQLDRDLAHAHKLGFRGKLCIHPSQIPAVNTAFSYSEAQVEWARKVTEAAQANGSRGAFRLEGQLVDRPVLERAATILAAADQRTAGSRK